MDLTRFLPMFFQETEEHLASMEGHLLRLDPRSPDAEALHSIFRAAHSVKGNSTIFGAKPLADVMHQIESILDQMRKEELRPTSDVISLLLETCDAVREELRRLKDSGDTDQTALQPLHERLERLTRADTDHKSRPDPSIEPAAGRSERFRVEVHLPPGQGIATLPLAELYAELGALGRIEDVQASDGAAGTLLLLFLLTSERHDTVRAKLVSLLGTNTVRVEHHETALQPAPDGDAIRPAHTGDTAFGLFSDERSALGSLGSSSSSIMRTTVFDSTTAGRRAVDHDSSPSMLGRRATDRMFFDRSSIRVDVDKVDRLLNLAGELVIAQSILAEAAQRIGAANDAGLRDSVAYVARQTRELQEAVMGIRLLPLDYLFSRLPRLVRDLAQKLAKDVELVTQGGDTELDKEMIEKLADPLMHLVRNSLDHGIESPQARDAAGKRSRGTVQIRASHQGGGILVEVQDDGAGFDRDRILRTAERRRLAVHPDMTDEQVWQLAFAPGFSTADAVSDVSGRGVGMDVVNRNIRALGGSVEVRSKRGQGTTIALRLPLTLAILDGMSVEIGGESFILPLSFIAEALVPQAGQVKSITGGPRVVQVRDSYVPLLDLQALLHIPEASGENGIAIVVEADGRQAALGVDRLLGQQQVVIKSLEANYRHVPGIAGATVLGSGRVALILDVSALLRAGLAPIKGMEELAPEAVER
ncbi:MAG TPA: chemotaxis protein CheW [Burkholderiales bacterium]|nr:chemotaxis protein CheW [Burkholderiales bacterium]